MAAAGEALLFACPVITMPRTPPGGCTVEGMAAVAHPAVTDRVVQRRRAVALARHYREAEGLSIAQIADRLGRSPATIKAYFDPDPRPRGGDG
jgi:AcrR family transcriptional regulator